MSRILIIGGHGKVALLLAPLLVQEGHTVTSVIRNAAHVGDVEATGAQALVADVETLDVDQLTNLVSGNDAVVWSAGAGGGDPQRTYAVDRDAGIRSIDAAEAAGIPRYIMVSYFGAGADHGIRSRRSLLRVRRGEGGGRRASARECGGVDDPRPVGAHHGCAHRSGGRLRVVVATGEPGGRRRGHRRRDRRAHRLGPHDLLQQRGYPHRRRRTRLRSGPEAPRARRVSVAPCRLS